MPFQVSWAQPETRMIDDGELWRCPELVLKPVGQAPTFKAAIELADFVIAGISNPKYRDYRVEIRDEEGELVWMRESHVTEP